MLRLRIFVCCPVFFFCAQVQAFTVDPAVYFAYSQPYHGGVRSFLSQRACPIPKRGVEKELISRFEIQEVAAKAPWKKSIQYIPQLGGAMAGCWVDIMKQGEPAVLVCIQRGDKLDTCVPIAKSYFLDTADLPKEPSKPNF